MPGIFDEHFDKAHRLVFLAGGYPIKDTRYHHRKENGYQRDNKRNNL
jgi:hypothetical protein